MTESFFLNNENNEYDNIMNMEKNHLAGMVQVLWGV